MSSFKEQFSEVNHYYDGYGYAVNAKDLYEARDKIFEYVDYSWLTEDMKERMKRELRENMRECWVRFHGFQDEDNDYKLRNCWVITSEWKGGKKGWKQVFESNYNKHYVEHGHRYEPKADERGHRVNYSYSNWNCDVCNQISILKSRESF